MRDDFAIFICTHGRPNKQLTLEALKNCGYTGKIYLVLDDTDETIQQYLDIYGTENVIIFNKNYYINADKYDNGSNELHPKCIVYAKRAVEDIANQLNFKYFAIADDDITKFSLRYPVANSAKRFKITDFDSVLSAYINVLSCDVAAIGFGHVTSYCGGANSFSPENLSKRYLPYQFILRNGNTKVNWTSWFAEDDITELSDGKIGKLWLVVPYVMQETEPIGDINATGGMVDTYKKDNMFVLNFNVIRFCPQSAILRYKPGKLNRYVITRYYDRCFPQLISEEYKK